MMPIMIIRRKKFKKLIKDIVAKVSENAFNEGVRYARTKVSQSGVILNDIEEILERNGF